MSRASRASRSPAWPHLIPLRLARGALEGHDIGQVEPEGPPLVIGAAQPDARVALVQLRLRGDEILLADMRGDDAIGERLDVFDLHDGAPWTARLVVEQRQPTPQPGHPCLVGRITCKERV